MCFNRYHFIVFSYSYNIPTLTIFQLLQLSYSHQLMQSLSEIFNSKKAKSTPFNDIFSKPPTSILEAKQEPLPVRELLPEEEEE